MTDINGVIMFRKGVPAFLNMITPFLSVIITLGKEKLAE
jgi:hypothetical protein